MRGKQTDQQMKERMARRIAKRKDLPKVMPRIPTRKEARALARYNMQVAKVHHINKFFANNWRSYLVTGKPAV